MEYFKELSATKIFEMATEFECQAMMYCFKTRFVNFEKNKCIVKQGEPIQDLVLILKGSATVESVDTLGNITILMQLKKGDVFGVESAYAGDEQYKYSLISNEKCFVMFMNKHRTITPCENRCVRHDIVIRRLMQMVSENNLKLQDKLNHMSKKTIREKLLSYFGTLAQDNEYFTLPFNKTELANYLSVDRSAMSSELSRMRDEGIIDFDHRHFRIIKKGK